MLCEGGRIHLGTFRRPPARLALEGAPFLPGRLGFFPEFVGLGVGHPEVGFEYDPDRPLDPWRMTERGGRLDLAFTPEGVYPVGRPCLGVSSYQVCGTYSGTVIDAGGAMHRFDLLYGVAEQGLVARRSV